MYTITWQSKNKACKTRSGLDYNKVLELLVKRDIKNQVSWVTFDGKYDYIAGTSKSDDGATFLWCLEIPGKFRYADLQRLRFPLLHDVLDLYGNRI